MSESWQCPKCQRWQSTKWARCVSEYDTGYACDGVRPMNEHDEPRDAVTLNDRRDTALLQMLDAAWLQVRRRLPLPSESLASMRDTRALLAFINELPGMTHDRARVMAKLASAYLEVGEGMIDEPIVQSSGPVDDHRT